MSTDEPDIYDIVAEFHEQQQARELKTERSAAADLHQPDCFLVTHNSKCDCSYGAAISRAATAMRDKCAGEVRALLETEVNGHVRGGLLRAVKAIESLTLEPEKQK